MQPTICRVCNVVTVSTFDINEILYQLKHPTLNTPKTVLVHNLPVAIHSIQTAYPTLCLKVTYF